ncbi:type 1 fimbria pilin [Pseudomonas nitritireducens]|uniref:Type 1 fimbria pilin n=1 Tax=Pseudomonas nitroreducens TaxID=46680 RepID=A0A7W7KGY1_PSENT|nr:fimbrial protein [Pseudomonas nitritireducens]MBB4862305.1 type 1 fimbria pilin [Pseudomonas nitritireducens]
MKTANRHCNSVILFALVLLLSSLLFASQSQADCRRANTGSSTHPTVDFGNMSEPRDTSVGTVLSTQMVDIDDANCDVLAGQSFNYVMLGTATGQANVYATNVGGVGVRVTPAADNGNSSYAPFVTKTLAKGNLFLQRKLKVELIKTGTIEAGKALSGLFYTGRASAKGFGSDAGFSGGVFQNVSCSTADVPVTLPTISVGAFRTGSIAGSTNFAISIDCSGASMATLNSLDYTLSNRTSIVDVANGAVALLPSSTSKGIAIRVSDVNDVPVRYNVATDLSSFNRSQTRFSIPLKAAYLKTGTPVPGTVETIVDFTISYR